MIIRIKRDNLIRSNIETVIKSMRILYRKAALVVECDRRVTGLIELLFNENDNLAMVVRVKRGLEDQEFVDYPVNKTTLRLFEADDRRLGVTLEIADSNNPKDTTRIVMYFLACLTPTVTFPKLPNSGVTVVRSPEDVLHSKYDKMFSNLRKFRDS